MSESLIATAFYLVNVIFGLYTIVIILRLFLQKFHAPFHNPIVQAVVTLTAPVVKPLQKIVPGIKGIDLAIVLLLLLVEMLKVALIVGLQLSTFPDVGGWVLWAIAAATNDICDVYFWAIIIGAVLSWIPSMQRSAFAEVVYYLTQPFLAIFQRFIPAVAGIDFSPLVAIVAIRVFDMLVIAPVTSTAIKLALS